jgi:hypothetical protein
MTKQKYYGQYNIIQILRSDVEKARRNAADLDIKYSYWENRDMPNESMREEITVHSCSRITAARLTRG